MRKHFLNRHGLSKTVVGLILAMSCAMASASDEKPAFDAAGVLEQQKQIRADVEASRGSYGQLNPATRQELRSRQDRLNKLLEGRGYDQLNEAERAQARQEIEWIAQAGADKEEDRMICERVRAIGSNRVERVCKSASQRREEQKLRVEPKLGNPARN